MDRIFEFIANTSDGVFAVDRHQAIVLWNEAATATLGFTVGEVLGKRCDEVLRGRDADGCAVCRQGCETIRAAQRLEFTPARDIAARTKRGHEIWLNVSTIVIPSGRRELSVLVHLFRSVNRQHELVQVVQDFADVMSRLSTTHQASRPPPSSGTSVDLTPREREVLGHLVTGLSTKSIAARLSISPRTVRNHINNLLVKLGVHSRLEAVTFSIQNGLI